MTSTMLESQMVSDFRGVTQCVRTQTVPPELKPVACNNLADQKEIAKLSTVDAQKRVVEKMLKR